VKRLFAYGVAVAALLSAPPHALAQAESAPSVVAIFPPMRGPSTLVIHGSTSDNRVVLRFDVATSEYLVSDDAGVEAATGCHAITAVGPVRDLRRGIVSRPLLSAFEPRR
jgi:hypothetical protein